MKRTPGWRRSRAPSNPSAEVGEELRFHIEGRVEELVKAGHDRAEATRIARERFGDLSDIHARCAAANTPRNPSGIRQAIELIVQDVRLALRNLYRRPLFSATVVVTVALALGATTAIFSVVNGVLLKPLPHPEPDRLVTLYEVDERPGAFDDHNRITIATFLDWKKNENSRVKRRCIPQSSIFNLLSVEPQTLREAPKMAIGTGERVNENIASAISAEPRVYARATHEGPIARWFEGYFRALIV